MNQASEEQRGKQTNPPRTGQEQRNAALSGALSAFNRPQTLASVPASGFSNSTGNNGPLPPKTRSSDNASASIASRKNSIQLQRTTSVTPQILRTTSNASSVALTKQVSSQSVPQSLERSTGLSKTSSSIGAALAAARFVGLAKTNQTQSPAARPQPVSPDPSDEKDFFPPSGTVQGVKKWLESLESDAPVDLDGDAEVGKDGSDTPKPRSPNRLLPPLNTDLDTSIESSSSSGVVTPRNATGIKSPKPIRPIPRGALTSKEPVKSSTATPFLPSPSPINMGQDPVSALEASVVEGASSPEVTPDMSLKLNEANEEAEDQEKMDAKKYTSLKSTSFDMPTPKQSISRASTAPAGPPVDLGHSSVASSIPSRPTPTPSLSRATTADTTGSMRVDALANSMIASHLALQSPAGRRSPSKSPNPLLRARDKARTPFQHFKQYESAATKMISSRTPSPAKAFNYTLRRDTSSSSEDDNPYERRRNKKKRFIHKHPNKHREGDRDRWKDTITERERKRYEGVWAANKGIHIIVDEGESQAMDARALDAAKTNVCNLVVRDIWSRSRLPDHILEEVWELVDKQQRGRLEKEQFVVGLWLIDQRLKGRKLPVKVGDSIWKSVRGIYGLNVR